MTTIQRNRDAAEKIANREPFRNKTGSLHAETFGGIFGPAETGRLPREYRKQESLKRATYVVFSYATPVAWVYRGQWHSPRLQYSNTTSRHMSIVRRGMARSSLAMTA